MVKHSPIVVVGLVAAGASRLGTHRCERLVLKFEWIVESGNGSSPAGPRCPSQCQIPPGRSLPRWYLESIRMRNQAVGHPDTMELALACTERTMVATVHFAGPVRSEPPLSTTTRCDLSIGRHSNMETFTKKSTRDRWNTSIRRIRNRERPARRPSDTAFAKPENEFVWTFSPTPGKRQKYGHGVRG